MSTTRKSMIAVSLKRNTVKHPWPLGYGYPAGYRIEPEDIVERECHGREFRVRPGHFINCFCSSACARCQCASMLWAQDDRMFIAPIPWTHREMVVGRVLRRQLHGDSPLEWRDFVPRVASIVDADGLTVSQ